MAIHIKRKREVISFRTRPLDGSKPGQLTRFDDADVGICGWR